MGRVYVKVRVYNPTDLSRSEEVELLVDSGSVYTVIPRSILEKLKVKPIGTIDIKVFGGVIAKREHGVVVVEYKGKLRGTSAIFGEKEDTPIMGVPLLEMLGYEIDPISKRIVPIRGKEI